VTRKRRGGAQRRKGTPARDCERRLHLAVAALANDEAQTPMPRHLVA